MKRFFKSLAQAFLAGALFLAPIYLAILLLLKAMKSLERVVRPLARILPDSFPADKVGSFLVVLVLCLLVGILLRTPLGRIVRSSLEKSFLEKIPGYEMFRSMTRQAAGESEDRAWKPALAEIENALVPAFIVEELDDGRFTVFVPSVPTPLAGAIYILTADRVHPLDASFTKEVRVLAHWGSGSQALVNAMQPGPAPSAVTK